MDLPLVRWRPAVYRKADDRIVTDSLPEIYVCNRASCTWLASPRFCGRFWDPAWASRSGAQRLGVGRSVPWHAAALPARRAGAFGVADGHRYVDFSIRYLAAQFDALGATRSEWR